MTGEVHRGDERFVLGSTTYEFMLATAGALGFSSSSPFAPKSLVGPRTYADYDPLSAIQFIDLTGGMGQERATDATKYYDAHNVDARGGRLVLGPLLHTNTTDPPPGLDGISHNLLVEGSPSLTYPGVTLDWFDIGASGTVQVAARFIAITGIVHIHSLWLPIQTTIGAGTITVSIYADSGGGNPTPTGAAIGTVALNRNYFNAAGAWSAVHFSTPVALTAGTAYWLSVEHAGASGNVAWYGGNDAANLGSADIDNAKQFVGGSWVATATPWHMIFWYDEGTLRPDTSIQYVIGAGEDAITRLWGFAARQLYYFNAAGLPTAVMTTKNDGAAVSPAVVKETAADIVCALWFTAPGGTYPLLYVGQGDTADAVTFDGNIGTEEWTTIAAGIKIFRLCTHDKTLFRAFDVNKISGSLDGATWADPGDGTDEVGDRTYPIRNIISWNGSVWVGKDDGLYQVTIPVGYPVSGSLSIVRVLNFATMTNVRNFAFLVEHQGDLYFPIGHGLLRYSSGGVVTPVTPQVGLNLATSERTDYLAACSTLNTLWVAANGPIGANTSLLAYTEGHWHPILTLPRKGDLCYGIIAEGGLYGSMPRVWFSAGLQTAYVNMPSDTNRRWLATDADYAATGYIDLSWIDGGIRTINKDWVTIESDAEGISAASGQPNAALYWRTNEADDFTFIRNVAITLGVDEGEPLIYEIPFPTASWGPKMQLRLVLTAQNGVTPQVLAVVVRYLERPRDSQAFTRTYVISPFTLYRNGQQVQVSIAEQVGWLETLRESAEPLQHTNWFGKTNTVHIVQYNCSERRSSRGDIADEGAVIATVQLQRIP